MPQIKVRNESAYSDSVQVGFFIFGMLHPTRWTNDLKPGGIFDGGDFPSWPVPQSFEVRRGGGAAHRGGAQYAAEVPESIKRVGLWVPWFSLLELVLRDGVDGIEVWCDGQQM